MIIKLGRKKPKSMQSVLRGAQLYLRLLAAAGVFMSFFAAKAHADMPGRSSPLPTPCKGGCGPSANLNWISGNGKATPSLSADAHTLTVHQQSDQVILNWATFDIAKDYSVNFQQPTSASIALNRVFSGDASSINGNLNANGQVYLINIHGIMFGGGSQVNLHTLVASTLDIDDTIFANGILSGNDSLGRKLAPAFAGDSLDAVIVEPGATLTAANGGRIMLLAKTVENGGSINTPDGQTILAAGGKVYLQESKDIALRGLLVEVDGGGAAKNLGTGNILAQRGNITMMGLAVNQVGRVTATTSVNWNGSIRLLASGAKYPLAGASEVGPLAVVTLEAGSVTEVLPETWDKATSLDEQKFNPSSVEVSGQKIRLQENSLIRAAGGRVALTAQELPSLDPTATKGAPNISRIYMESGSVIDVSGTTDTVLAMEHNQLDVELLGNALQDAPLQRNGFLSRKKITIDIRKGTKLANVQAAIDGVGKTIGERTAQGGSVTLISEGDIITRPGANINVSGGSIEYTGGYLNTTKLVSDGRVYDIGDATPDRIYDGIVGPQTVTNQKWGVSKTWNTPGAQGQYHPGYTDGANAGTVQVFAPGLVLDGTLTGTASVGALQRDPGQSSQAPSGGTLIIGNAAQDGVLLPDYRAPSVILQAHTTPEALGIDAPPRADQPLILDTDFLERGGFTQAAVYSNGKITIAADTTVRTAPGGDIKLTAQQIDVQGSVVVPAGNVSLQTRNVDARTPYLKANITVSSNSNISTRGQWVNDTLNLPGAGQGLALINGGDVTIKSVDLHLQQGSRIDVGGGAWLKANGKIINGNGGTLALETASELSTLELGAQLSGDAFGKGGTLKITANTVRVDPTPDAPLENTPNQELVLAPEFFQHGGFSKYEIASNVGGLTITGDTLIAPRAETRVLDANFRRHASGADVREFSSTTVLADALRKPVDLTFKVTQSAATDVRGVGDVHVEQGAQILAETGAKVTLESTRSIHMDGIISAPAGAITLRVTPPPLDLDSGYTATKGIWLGAHSQLLSVGALRYRPNAQGLLKGDVLNAGTVTLQADRGYVVAEAGSRIDVSGVSAPLDLPGTHGVGAERTLVAGKAGTINITASEGMLLDGVLVARAAAGVGTQGGALQLMITRQNSQLDRTGLPPPPNTPREIVIRSGDTPTAPVGFSNGDDVPLALNGQALINANTLANGGFERFAARANDAVRFSGGVDLKLKQSIVLDAPALALNADSHVTVDAAYIALGNTLDFKNPAQMTTTGTGTFAAHGQLIDVFGSSVTQGIQSFQLNSDGDLRLRGVLSGVNTAKLLTGELRTAADVTLRADQIYPTTLSSFTLAINKDLNPTGTITIAPGSGATRVLSAGGKLTLDAPNIVQQGVIKAPLGEVVLNASDQLTLADGSITSVSGDGQLIPFGTTQRGQQWVYAVNGATPVDFNAPPEKRISLNGKDVDLGAGATIDVSGGGDLYAYELFAPGPGGSRDVLGDPKPGDPVTPVTYAILPQLKDGIAPFDPQYYAGSSLQPGDSIYIAGVAGLEDGVYPLLPAHYALLPGAFTVQSVSGYQDLQPGRSIRLRDGTPIVAGYHTVAGTDVRDARTSGFAVRSGATARTQTEFHDSYASTFYPALARRQDTLAPLLPQDAGRLAINATQTLSLESNVKTADDGQGAQVDIAAKNLSVVDNIGADDGSVQLAAAQLNRLGAASLLLGGTRATNVTDANGTDIAVTADRVRVAENAHLQGAEILLVAKEKITVEHNSVVAGTDTAPRGAAADTEVLHINGDGALLRVSADQQVRVQRDNSSGVAGTLDIQQGAELKADRSMTLDAAFDTRLDGSLKMRGGSLNLGATQINLGAVPPGKNGVTLDAAKLVQLTVDELVLTSRNAVDVFGAVDLNFKDVDIQAPGLTGHNLASGDTLKISAQHLKLSQNSSATVAVVVNTDASSGTLQLTANQLDLGTGVFGITGYEKVDIAARDGVQATAAGALNVSGDLTLTTPRITGTHRADYSVKSDAALRVASNGNSLAKPNTQHELGARLAFSGRSLDFNSLIDAPSGRVTFTATGAGENVKLGDMAAIDVSGSEKIFGGSVVKYAPGGAVILHAEHGNVTVASGAQIDVSGARDGGRAGQLSVQAVEGSFENNGNLLGNAHAGEEQAVFALDVNTLDKFGALNTALNEGGFSGARAFRQRGTDVNGNGDLVVGDSATVRAQHVSIAVDQGGITVAAASHGVSIAASGERGGVVELAARDNITLAAGASIDASADGADQSGGRVVLSTQKGELDLQADARIDVSGAQGGEVHLRAPRVGSNEVAINSSKTLAADIVGAEKVTVEAFRVYQTDTITTDLQNFWKTDTATYMSNAGAMLTRLGKTNDATFHITPGVEVQNITKNGDLTLKDDWDLHDSTWRYDAEPGVLVLRAAGNIKLDASLSDGFSTAKAATGELLSGDSWSYRIVAGSDLSAADVLAVQAQDQLAADQGSVILADDKLVRTGTGDIDVAAGRDVLLSNQQKKQKSVIYTAGAKLPGNLTNFTAPGTAVYANRGGDICISAQRDIKSAPSDQLITDWLFRQGRSSNNGTLAINTSWWPVAQLFEQGVAALGGGDVSVHAGHNIENLSVSIPTSGRLPVAAGQVPDLNMLDVQGGGDLFVSAGNDIKSGVYYVSKGQGVLRAGGAVTAGRTVKDTGGNTNADVHTILALDRARMTVEAARGVTLETALNPGMALQGKSQNVTQGLNSTYFFNYSPDASVDVSALSGDVVFNNDSGAIRAASVSLRSGRRATEEMKALTVYPGTLHATALQGGVAISKQMILYPSAQGGLRLLAHTDVKSGGIVLSDADPILLPSLSAPQIGLGDAALRLPDSGGFASYVHAATAVHLNDDEPVQVVAQEGDITGSFYLAKSARLSAGRDVRDVTLLAQNISATDVTLVNAGRDIVNTSGDEAISVAGPGNLDVIAGRDIDLGVSKGITTTGNITNPALHERGADITVLAGVGESADYAAFITRYLEQDAGYSDLLNDYLTGLHIEPSGVAAFRALTREQQRELILQVFFDELRASGRAANTGSSKEFRRGRDAIATLFPGTDYAGDINLYFSRIYTQDGGDINLLVPGGLVNAGLANTPPDAPDKPPSELGIVAQGPGSVSAYSSGDFLVNQSRVFTLGGGDILMWADHGNIDAGRGSKSAISAPAPTIETNDHGIVEVNFSSAITGSGIRGILTDPNVKPGDVDLIAPEGTVDAGDAGIGAAGNLNIAAQHVKNADNIQVGGISTGVPVSDTGAFAASLSGVSNVASSVTKSAEQALDSAGKSNTASATPMADAALTFLDVEVLGYGECNEEGKNADGENCKTK